MKVFKRCYLSLIRHPFQTGVQFLIVFILGNFLCAAIAIQQASVQVREKIVEKIPADITMVLENDKMIRILEEKPLTLIEDLKKEANVNNVYSQTTMSIPFYLNEFTAEPYLLAGLSETQDSIFNYEFVEGRGLTNQEIQNNEAKIVIHESFNQNYKVGDVLSIPIYDYALSDKEFRLIPNMETISYIDFEIVGIFSDFTLKEEYQSGGVLYTMPMMEVSQQKMYEMREIQEKQFKAHSQADKDMLKLFPNYETIRLKPLVTYIRVDVSGMDQADQLVQSIKKNPNYISGYYSLKTSADDYRYVQAPLENLVQLSNITLIGSACLVVVLLSIVSVLFLKGRTHEIGILMAMGERKIKILIQFVCEIMVAGLLATTLALVSGNYLGNIVSKQFIRMQVDTEQEEAYSSENPDAVTQLDLLEDYAVGLDVQYVAVILLSSGALLFISSALPMMFVLKVKPKKVLM